MADITTIRKSISKMSDDEIDALIQERRAARRTVISESRSTKRSSGKKKKKKSKNPKKDIMASLASLSEKEKQKLKEMLS